MCNLLYSFWGCLEVYWRGHLRLNKALPHPPYVSQGRWVAEGPTSSQSFRYNSDWLCMGSTLSLPILSAVLPQCPPPLLLNVQRIAKTVPFTNAVYPLVLRTEWAAEMASPLLPLAVETLCKEYSFAFFSLCVWPSHPFSCGKKIKALGGLSP